MEQLDFLRIDYPLPDPEVQDFFFYTKGLGGGSHCYRVSIEGELQDEGKLLHPFDPWQYRGPTLCSYIGKLDIWTSMQVDGDHSQRFEYRLQFEDGWLKSIEKL